MSRYYTLSKYSSVCHIFEFSPTELRLDATIGVPKKLERLSKITGEPKNGEVPYAKINGGFFAMNGASEYIGTFIDEGNLYSSPAVNYPTLIYWKSNNRLTYEINPSQARCNELKTAAWFAIGVPWMLVIDGKANYLYNKQQLVNWFGHPWIRNPRTLIGQKADGTIVWVVVDGRSKASAGFTIDHSSSLMLQLGCTIAANLDGGGSSEMIVDGVIKNKPSDGAERAIGTAFIAYKKTTPVQVTPASGTATVTCTSLNVRSGPGTSYATYGTVSKGQTFTVTGIAGGWYQINYNGRTAYVSGDYVSYKMAETSSPSPTPSASSPTRRGAVVNCSVLNVRSGPGTGYSILGGLTRNTRVIIVGQKDNWYEIQYNGKTGYISVDYVTTIDMNTPTGVTQDALNLRTGPGTNNPVIICMPKGTTIDILATQNGWYKTVYRGYTGWCSATWVK